MPSFYPQTMPGHLPLTPPYSAQYEQQSCIPSQYTHDSYAHQQPLPPRLDSAMDYSHRYPPPASSTQQNNHQRSSYCGQNLPPISSYYEPIGAPLLPPLRIQDAYRTADRDYYHHSYQQEVTSQASQQPAHAPKEEQVSGGVSAKLDYEMERMTDFVSEAAQGMYALHSSGIPLGDIDIFRSILPGTTIQPHFRKWVSQVLTATRLPSATILLSLHYLTVRMRDFPSTIAKSEHSLYRLLTVSMILGSKFLDDNTFINRSWSDVTSIKVVELNSLEIEWLALIGFDLHADSTDPNGVSLWIRAWNEYDARAISKARSMRLSPLNTNIDQSKSLRSGRSTFQPGYTKTAHGTYTPLSSGSAASAHGTPYVSSDPWNSADQNPSDFYSTQARYQSLDEFAYNRYGSQFSGRSSSAPYSQYSLPPLQSVAPSFYTPWNHNTWEHNHGYGCHCVGCSRQASSYMMGTSFAPQTVVG
ncbi:Meiotically up-regulated protein 80 protein [Sphaceloma murrayae]|uniref:Meiotically up-regulated protein 80 protein n=1 Tax=Sphaceloma murrayae TaxID=2082308 RepID=A0A2K1QFD5_9PEZI|nr:Meiotically up-regulated protein 80 protein [Sphaceloma murrayae]